MNNFKHLASALNTEGVAEPAILNKQRLCVLIQQDFINLIFLPVSLTCAILLFYFKYPDNKESIEWIYFIVSTFMDQFFRKL